MVRARSPHPPRARSPTVQSPARPRPQHSDPVERTVGCRLADRRMTEAMNLPGCLAHSVAAHAHGVLPIGERPPPSPLDAAECRLALCAVRHERLAASSPQLAFARSEVGRLIVEMIGKLVVAFDYEEERFKLRRFGPAAAAARAQFVPTMACSPWRSYAGRAPSECRARCHADAHCPSCQRVGRYSGREQAQAAAFLLEGHPQAAFNGLYRTVSEHNGFPVFRNGRGMHCLRSQATHAWFLSDHLDPNADFMTAMFPMSEHEGPFPTDELSHETCWLCVDAHDESWISRPFRFHLLLTEADVAAALARLPQYKEAEEEEEEAATDLESLVVSGCPQPLLHCNGQYARCEQPPRCGGWGHYRNDAGCRLYFCELLGRWFINAHFTPELVRHTKAYPGLAIHLPIQS